MTTFVPWQDCKVLNDAWYKARDEDEPDVGWNFQDAGVIFELILAVNADNEPVNPKLWMSRVDGHIPPWAVVVPLHFTQQGRIYPSLSESNLDEEELKLVLGIGVNHQGGPAWNLSGWLIRAFEGASHPKRRAKGGSSHKRQERNAADEDKVHFCGTVRTEKGPTKANQAKTLEVFGPEELQFCIDTKRSTRWTDDPTWLGENDRVQAFLDSVAASRH